ncbi:hypothetical protein [Halalkalicoccus paucihalophilus]|uniref:hypothetical protein n=1 Tax=Halalkalicoccus paucihalophilus TaxID=1008153 RepID=UPI0012EE107C|nr:hypothetical protein [Halalkalicoccus paucihalophilus]
MISVSCLFIDDHELPATTLHLLDVVFLEFCEEVHNAGHSLGMGLIPSTTVDNRDRLAIEYGANRRFLGPILHAPSDEVSAFLVGRELAIDNVFEERTDPI